MNTFGKAFDEIKTQKMKATEQHEVARSEKLQMKVY